MKDFCTLDEVLPPVFQVFPTEILPLDPPKEIARDIKEKAGMEK